MANFPEPHAGRLSPGRRRKAGQAEVLQRFFQITFIVHDLLLDIGRGKKSVRLVTTIWLGNRK